MAMIQCHRLYNNHVPYALIALLFLTACSKQISQKDIFAIHIHGDWCNTCKTVDPVIHEAAAVLKDNKHVEVIIFNETNPESVAKSGKLAHQKGLDEIFEFERHTGEMLFVDKANNEILTKFYGVNNVEQYVQAALDIIDGKEVESIEAQRKNYDLSKPSIEKVKKAKLYVVDLHHDRCGGCSITTPVFERVAEKYKKNKKIAFMTFDLTTRDTVLDTQKLAKALEIEDIYKAQKHTGEVLFIDAKKKEILASLVLERDDEKYHKLIDKLI